MAEQIYGLIGKAMKMVGAIGKDSVNEQQKYRFRGIDAVYNTLNPVMAELGLFICPEILDHRREERENVTTYNNQTKKTVLKYSILTIKYTMYAPDGSNISCVVVGEEMDSGDKASNKAMSVAMKYAMFQLFMIPTEELVDPDRETYEVTSAAQTPKQPEAAKQTKVTGNTAAEQPVKPAEKPVEQATKPAEVKQAQTLPNPDNPVTTYLARERKNLAKARGISEDENRELFTKQLAVLKSVKAVPEKPLSKYDMKEAEILINLMYTKFSPTGTELLTDDGKTA